MKIYFHTKRGFTLLELLIVIGILAILSVLVTFVLNPMELKRKANDSKRMDDLASLRNVIQLYQVEFPDDDLGSTTCPPSTPCRSNQTSFKVDGNGWIPINFTKMFAGSPISNLPSDPVNNDSYFYSYATDGTTFELTCLFESEDYQAKTKKDGGDDNNLYEVGTNLNITSQYVLVPGNSQYGTDNFWVMKYEAKCDHTGNGIGDNAGDYGCKYTSSYDTWDWGKTGCDCINVVSTPQGSPIAGITHTQAISACQTGYHLITNDEWMTITRNIEKVAANWQSEEVGTGCMYGGHMDNHPATALIASTDDNPYYGTGDSAAEGAVCPFNTSDGKKASKRTFTLSNNQVIWDISGNVCEHVKWDKDRDGDDDYVTDADQPDSGTHAGSFGWTEFPDLTSYGTLSSQIIQPSDPSYNSSKGVGKIYHCDSCSGSTAHVFLRGGRWSHGADAGAFALDLAWETGDGPSTLGFRCVR